MRAEVDQIATQIAVGALRYFMLRFTRTTVIAFDLQEQPVVGPDVEFAGTGVEDHEGAVGEFLR